MNNISRQDLTAYINAISLSLYDTMLFLDTHPDDAEALAYFNKLSPLRQQAVQEYEMQFGPLTADSISNADSWKWVTEPWPWERGC